MAIIEGYNLPDNLYYHENGTWVKLQGENVRIGVTDFYQKLAGKITYLDFPFENDELTQGDPCGRIQFDKLIAPVSGTVITVNQELEDNLNIINKEPYGSGWIIIVRTSNIDEELKNLYHGEKALEWLKNKITSK
ncbi:MAG: glycine cleavage system protein H [bacterium]|nr:glycine cleavage system protein H [bacterium]